MHRFVWLVAIALVVVACGGGGVATPTPGSQATLPPVATATPGGAPTAQPNTGDSKSLARMLIPPGATQLNEVQIGNSYTVQLSSTQSLEQLAAFWTGAIPAAGLTETGRFPGDGSLVIAFSNPDGGITASPTEGGIFITISVGTSG